MKRRRLHSGFTLLELVLVMLIIVIAVGVTVPRLSGWNRGRELNNSAETFIALTRLARSQAITNSIVYRIQFEAESGKYQLKKQMKDKNANGYAEFTEINTSMGKVFTAPDGGKILLTVETDAQQSGDTLECINFYPNGRTQKASIVISDKTGRTIQATCESATEEFTVKQADGAS